MEAKKNPSKDVHRMSGMFFQIGLGISIAIVLTAFEWRTEVKQVSARIMDEPPMEFTFVPNTDHKEPPPPSAIKTTEPITKSIDPSQIVLASENDPNQTSDEPVAIEPTVSIPSTYYVPTEDPEDCPTCFFCVVEKNAEPIGGLASFYKFLSANLKYPRKAIQNEIAGKVYVEFIVNREGNTEELKVSRGMGYGLDEEAMRVIALSKWNPGKQRGKPVRVKMVMPIVFTLN
jgi:periplasmic protein TonB